MQSACCWASKVVTAARTTLRPAHLEVPIVLRRVRGVQHKAPKARQVVHGSHAVLSQYNCRALATGSSTVQMDPDVGECIQKVHDNSAQAVFYATGGGMQVHLQQLK